MPISEPSGEDDLTGRERMLASDAAGEVKPDQVLAGRYKVEAFVGRGAMGLVVRAYDNLTKGVVALKIVKPDMAKGDEWMKFLGGELRHARKIQHPNVCRVFDVGEAETEAGKLPFLTMEFAEGGSLRAALKAMQEAGTSRSFPERVADARAVLDGLAAIHALGIIHRDIKPDNILRAKDGRLMLSDFGLAVAPGQTTFLTNYSGRVGTPSYMAPEVALGGPATKAADIWSLGVVLHEILFGDRPHFQFLKSGRKVKSPLGPTATRAERSLFDLIRDCLAENPHHRPADAADARRRFDLALDGRDGRVLRTLRRHALKLAAAAAVAAFPIAAVTFALVRGRDAGESRSEAVPVVKAKLEGVAEDWIAMSRVVATFDSTLRCLDVLPGGRSVRVVLDAPSPAVPGKAVDLDLTTGAQSAPPLGPETLKVGCPQVSPDGRRLLYTVRRGVGRSEIFLAQIDGQEAGRLTDGDHPRWLPNASEFAFGVDDRGAAVFALSNRLTLLPRTDSNQRLLRIVVSAKGDRVGVLSTTLQGTGRLELFGFPSASVLERVELPGTALSAAFDSKDRLHVSLRDGPRWYAARLAPAGRLHRLGHAGDTTLVALEPAGAGLVFAAARRETTIAFVDGAKEEDILRGPYANPVALGTDLVLFQERLDAGGTRVISAWRRTTGVTRLTRGPDDAFPFVCQRKRRVGYVDVRSGSIVVCELSESGAFSCQSFLTDPLGARVPAFSPDCTRIAYLTSPGKRDRLRVADSDGRRRDLGAYAFSGCPPRWGSERSLLVLARHGEILKWQEIDVEAGKPTGRWEEKAAGDSCARATPESTRGPRLKSRTNVSVEVRTLLQANEPQSPQQ